MIDQTQPAIKTNRAFNPWALLEEDKLKRQRRSVKPQVFHYCADALIDLVPIGTVIVFVARRDCPLLSRIKDALIDCNTELLSKLSSELSLYFGMKRPLKASTPLEAAQLLLQEPVFAELRYEGKVLAPVLAAPEDNPLGGLLLPYAGGTLNIEAFAYEEYLANPECPGLEVVVIAREPPLSDLERTVVEKVAANEIGGIIGPGHYGIWPAALLAVLLVTLTGTACLALREQMAKIGLSSDDVTKLGASASVQKLLSLREQALL